MNIPSWFSAVLCSAAIASPLNAEVTTTDMQVAGRALSFMESPLTGVVRVGILYSPNSSASQREAEHLKELLGNGLRAGNVELRPEIVKISDAARSKVDLFFLTEFVDAAEAKAAGLSVANKRPCVTVDIAQVERGACLMGVRVTREKKVEIVVNRAAAKNSGVVFATVFRVMITEI